MDQSIGVYGLGFSLQIAVPIPVFVTATGIAYNGLFFQFVESVGESSLVIRHRDEPQSIDRPASDLPDLARG
jgi:hypothetical protein